PRTAARTKAARIWDPASPKEIAVLRHDGDVNSAAFSSDGSRIVTASNDNTARIWDAATAKEIAVLRGHRDSVTSAAFSRDGSRIVTTSRDETARLYGLSRRRSRVRAGHSPALGERRHRGLARRLVAVGRSGVFVIAKGQRPQPWLAYRRGRGPALCLARSRRAPALWRRGEVKLDRLAAGTRARLGGEFSGAGLKD